MRPSLLNPTGSKALAAPTRRGGLRLQVGSEPAPTLNGSRTHPMGVTRMSPLMMRFFTLVGIALAAASMQLKARAEPGGLAAPTAHVVLSGPRT